MNQLKAGIARRDLTPPLDTLLFGYPGHRPAAAIADPLNVTALVLQSGSTSAAILSLDWCLIDGEETAALRALIHDVTGIAPQNVTLCATHTHSGPVTVECAGWGKQDTEYLRQSRAAIVEAVAEAQRNLQPARVGIAATHTETGINRREVNENGEVILGFNPWGAVDRELSVVRFEGGAGPLAALVHLGAHPTARGSEPSVSRDWPGVMMDRIEKMTGAPVLFINGAFGDVAPRTNLGAGAVGDGTPAAIEVGLRAASDALHAWREIREFRNLELDTLTRSFSLPHAPLPPREEAEREAREYSDGENAWGARRAEWSYWNAVLAAHEEAPVPARTWQQTVTRLGPIVLVPFAGEIFAEIALRLKRLSPFAHTLCAGTSNGSHGYYVTREARARGGYEPWVAKAYGAYILADNIDDVLVGENLKLLRELSAQGEDA